MWKIKIPFAPKLMSFETMLDYDNLSFTHPKLLERLKCESESKNNKRSRNRSMIPNLQHFGVKRERQVCVGAAEWGLPQMTSKSIIHMDLHKPNNKLVNA
jgi:hypothetical protein